MPSRETAMLIVTCVRVCCCAFLSHVQCAAWFKLASNYSLVWSMDNALVELLRSVRADSGEQAQEVTEVQDILLSNRIKVPVVVSTLVVRISL